jgi:hypothetical protein
MEAFPVVPKTPSKPSSALPDQNVATNGRITLFPPIILRKDVDIDYVPISPKKSKFAPLDMLGVSGVSSKVRELRELSTGSRSMPTLSNTSMATPTKKSLFGTPRHCDTEPDEYGKRNALGYNDSRVRTAEEKKDILGGMLGNVDALVEGVRKAGIWGLGSL